MRRMLIAGLLLCAASSTFAQVAVEPAVTMPVKDATPTTMPDDEVVNLDTVVVSGAQPGPGLWKVSKGERTLWILGTLSPLPRRMQWESAEVQRVIAASQELIESPSVSVGSNIGMFRGLFLMPSLLKARKNPDGKSLQQIIPPTQYARWQVLKQRYIGSDRGIEQWRPVFAALELYQKAIDKAGMTQSGVVAPVVEASAKQYKLKITRPRVEIPVANPKAMLKEFASESLADLDCFTRTLDRIEGDLDAMVARANAWSTGDLEALRALPYNNQFTACNAAMTGAGIARKIGFDNIDERIERTWMTAAESALANNSSTFATLPISQLLLPDGYLAKLRAKGYAVEAP